MLPICSQMSFVLSIASCAHVKKYFIIILKVGTWNWIYIYSLCRFSSVWISSSLNRISAEQVISFHAQLWVLKKLLLMNCKHMFGLVGAFVKICLSRVLEWYYVGYVLCFAEKYSVVQFEFDISKITQ